ncbi:hypothetical protein FisN_15Lu126 [Fistulifera solaris]|uniref:Uncharacterized protein n=1 Tax=Fistulifera solaris TaxID=1519565 RepID=A0A1Z5KB86_FISSO|nr:hypothetical protein FisN_15Lu126 [Fistulifera solaris]|eukprot:GAX23405.1 hypothetical protein FisN_15Lu126 [Fistulifera solaris]
MSSTDAIDELTASLKKQTLEDTVEKSSHLPPPGKRFTEELDKTGFTIFRPISDLGFFEWKPDLKVHSPFNKVSVDELKRQLDVKGAPALLVETRSIRFPVALSYLSPQIYKKQYPLSNYEIVGVYVATKIRGLQLDEIDFVFGGSTLSMLANENENGKKYLVTKIPGTSVGLIAKDDEYDLNLADSGFQFERVVTGKRIDAREEPTFTEHLQLMQVGPFKVLFIAEADALKDGEPVEVACSSPYYWGIKKCLQCVSSGSPVLCHGTKYRGSTITSITMKALSAMYESNSVQLRKAQKHIINALVDLKEQLENSTHSGDSEISFSYTGKINLRDQRGPSKLLPSFDLVKELLA